MWIRSEKSLPEISIKFPDEGRSIKVLVWHHPTESPFVGQLVKKENGTTYFVDEQSSVDADGNSMVQIWWIEVEHCPFWMHIPFIPTASQYF